MVPTDLRKMLDRVLSTRNHGSAELWGKIREWLVMHGVETPERLPDYEEIERLIDP